MNTSGLTVDYRIKLYRNGSKCFGPGVALLLRGVMERGSLNAAAKSMNMAYSKAWKVIKTSEDALGVRLIEAQTGGRHGGGARLTPEGQELLEKYEAFLADSQECIQRLFLQRFKS